MQKGGRTKPRDGDWMCPTCNNNNYSWRQACNRCGEPKAGMSAAGMPHKGGSKGAASQQDGWRCIQCGNHNYAFRDACNRCQSPRVVPPYAPQYEAPRKVTAYRDSPYSFARSGPTGPTIRPGDWFCQGCANHNYASRESCNKCGKPKHAPAKFRDGDWICPECKNHNYASRTSCNKCGSPQAPEQLEEEEEEGDIEEEELL